MTKRLRLFMFNVILSLRNILLTRERRSLILIIIIIFLIKIRNGLSLRNTSIFNRNRLI